MALPQRVLLTWELGDNLGHIAKLLKIGEELSGRGAKVFLALQNLAGVATVLGTTPVTVLAAPYAKVKPPRTARPVLTYADDLRPCGYDDPRELAVLIKAWQNLFDLVRPDMMIANSSPTALLAARPYPFKKMAVGLGYEVPVLSTPMPPLRYWEKQNPDVIATHEASVVEVINEALRFLGQGQISSIAEMLKVDREFVSTFAELDHYGVRAPEIYSGPFFVADRGKDVAWPEQVEGRKRIFAYLSHGRDFEALLNALSSLAPRHDVMVVARRLPEEIAAKLRTGGMQVFTEAVRIDQITQDCNLCITHGGTGTFIQFLLAGAAQLIVPNHIEQMMVAKRVEALGAGRVGQPNGSGEAAQALICEVLDTPRYAEAARIWAARHAGYSVVAQTRQIVDQLSADDFA
ncbi:MAG: nucleotide disphospho-sugar-binding domain-containing protein [Pseudobdellovibrionaceae bacterium]